MCIMPQTASQYLENCRRKFFDRFFVNLYFFQQKLATLQTNNSANFQNILNRLSNDAFEGFITVFGIILFKKTSMDGRVTQSVK